MPAVTTKKSIRDKSILDLNLHKRGLKNLRKAVTKNRGFQSALKATSPPKLMTSSGQDSRGRSPSDLPAAKKQTLLTELPSEGFGRKLTPYALQLQAKQNLLCMYGLTSAASKKYLQQARKYKQFAGHYIYCTLQSRLETRVWRLGFSPTIFSARQLILHGHICVNGKKVTKPGFPCDSTHKISCSRLSVSFQPSRESIPSQRMAFPLVLMQGDRVVGRFTKNKRKETRIKPKHLERKHTPPQQNRSPYSIKANKGVVGGSLLYRTNGRSALEYYQQRIKKVWKSNSGRKPRSLPLQRFSLPSDISTLSQTCRFIYPRKKPQHMKPQKNLAKQLQKPQKENFTFTAQPILEYI